MWFCHLSHRQHSTKPLSPYHFYARQELASNLFYSNQQCLSNVKYLSLCFHGLTTTISQALSLCAMSVSCLLLLITCTATSKWTQKETFSEQKSDSSFLTLEIAADKVALHRPLTLLFWSWPNQMVFFNRSHLFSCHEFKMFSGIYRPCSLKGWTFFSWFSQFPGSFCIIK